MMELKLKVGHTAVWYREINTFHKNFPRDKITTRANDPVGGKVYTKTVRILLEDRLEALLKAEAKPRSRARLQNE